MTGINNFLEAGRKHSPDAFDGLEFLKTASPQRCPAIWQDVIRSLVKAQK
jgi:hypothetical protein